MDIKTYTQLNIHTRHILHSYKAHVDGYKNLHTTKYTHKTYLAFTQGLKSMDVKKWFLKNRLKSTQLRFSK